MPTNDFLAGEHHRGPARFFANQSWRRSSGWRNSAIADRSSDHLRRRILAEKFCMWRRAGGDRSSMFNPTEKCRRGGRFRAANSRKEPGYVGDFSSHPPRRPWVACPRYMPNYVRGPNFRRAVFVAEHAGHFLCTPVSAVVMWSSKPISEVSTLADFISDGVFVLQESNGLHWALPLPFLALIFNDGQRAVGVPTAMEWVRE